MEEKKDIKPEKRGLWWYIKDFYHFIRTPKTYETNMCAKDLEY